MATDVLTAVPDTAEMPDVPDVLLSALDGWDVELVFDAGTEVLQPLAATATGSAVADNPFATVTPAAVAPAPQNLVQMAVFPTVQETPTTCMRLWAASLIGLGSLLFASALFGQR